MTTEKDPFNAKEVYKAFFMPSISEMSDTIDRYMNDGILTSIRPDYHKDWNAIHDVWQKLRGELRVFRTNTPITNMKYVQAYDLENSIKEAITEEDAPTTAHRLMVEAIELIKK